MNQSNKEAGNSSKDVEPEEATEVAESSSAVITEETAPVPPINKDRSGKVGDPRGAYPKASKNKQPDKNAKRTANEDGILF